MAKPDMSRNKDLAGKTVSKGGYNISYNEDVYKRQVFTHAGKDYETGTTSSGTVTPKASARDVYSCLLYTSRCV